MASSVDIGAVFADLVESFIKLPLAQKVIYPLLIVGTVAGIVFVSRWASAPDYAVLFSDLTPTDSAAVIEQLKEDKIAYEIRGDGSSIAVSPAQMVHELRLTLKSMGIPQGGRVGMELFDESELGVTTFQEKVKFLRATQGELERTISALDIVRNARVAITQPERSLFAKKHSEPTASVLLMLRPGTTLTSKQAQGIMNLVAGAVENMPPENVSLIDENGNLLNPAEQEDSLAEEATRLTYRQGVEQSYVHRIEQMVSRIVGPGKVVARVTASMDFSANERTEEIYDPGGQVIFSERVVADSTGSDQRGGVPGVVSNLEEAPDVLDAPGNGQATRSESVRNYKVSKAISTTSAPRGTITRLSVAVLVDGTYQKSTAEAATEVDQKEFIPLDSDVLARIESLVKSAVGYDPSRGDVITVENIPFYNGDQTFADQFQEQTLDQVLKFVNYAGPFLFGIIFLFVCVLPLVKAIVNPSESEVDLERLLPTGLADLEAELEAERRAASTLPDIEHSVDIDQLNDIIAENSATVKDNPEQAALLIRYWLNDGRM